MSTKFLSFTTIIDPNPTILSFLPLDPKISKAPMVPIFRVSGEECDELLIIEPEGPIVTGVSTAVAEGTDGPMDFFSGMGFPSLSFGKVRNERKGVENMYRNRSLRPILVEKSIS
jgi:hypothetical protein